MLLADFYIVNPSNISIFMTFIISIQFLREPWIYKHLFYVAGGDGLNCHQVAILLAGEQCVELTTRLAVGKYFLTSYSCSFSQRVFSLSIIKIRRQKALWRILISSPPFYSKANHALLLHITQSISFLSLICIHASKGNGSGPWSW